MKVISKKIYYASILGLLLSCSDEDSPVPGSDPNEEPAVVISAAGFSAEVDENPTNSALLGTVVASASDQSTIAFSIASESVTGAIDINQDGEVTVADSTLFDFEENPVIEAEIVAGSGEISETVTIEINLKDEVMEKDNGLIAYLPFNGNLKDASDNATNGVDYGVAYTKDRFDNADKAVVLDGSGDAAITVPSLPSSSSFSIAVWIKDDGTATTTYRTIASKVNTDGFVGFSFRLAKVGVQGWEHGGLNGFFNNSGSNGLDSKTRPLSSNEWIHCVMTFDNNTSETDGMGTARIYENGVLVGEDTNVQFDPLEGLIGVGAQARPQEDDIKIVLGRSMAEPSFSSPFSGSMDDLAFFDRALTKEEVEALSSK